MLDQLLLNTRVHLRFYARNRLLLAFALVMVAIFSLSLIPMVLFDTSANRFSTLQAINGQLNVYAVVFTSSLGLFAVSSHLRNRNIKMVLTKPCPPSRWLASIYLSALLVGLTLHALIALGGLALSFWWTIPVQSGFLFVTVHWLFVSTIWLSLVTALTMAFHPVVAVLLALFVNEGTFYSLQYVVASAHSADPSRRWLAPLGLLVDGAYTLVPMADPFQVMDRAAWSSWRTAPADWVVLLEVSGYAVLLMALSYAVSLYLLRRKALI